MSFNQENPLKNLEFLQSPNNSQSFTIPLKLGFHFMFLRRVFLISFRYVQKFLGFTTLQQLFYTIYGISGLIQLVWFPFFLGKDAKRGAILFSNPVNCWGQGVFKVSSIITFSFWLVSPFPSDCLSSNGICSTPSMGLHFMVESQEFPRILPSFTMIDSYFWPLSIL